MMTKRILAGSITLACLCSATAMAATESEFLNLLDNNTDDLVYYGMENDGFGFGGMCFEDGDLEWYTDGSCAGTSEEMTLTSGGNLGIGVTSPSTQLHMASGAPAITLEDTGDQTWRIDGNDDFNITLNGSTIFLIEDDGLLEGNIGFGENNPSAPLHIRRDDSTQEFLWLESTEAGPQDRAMMYLENNGGIRFEFANDSLATAWRFQAATGGNDVFEVTKVGTGEIEMTVTANGDLILGGSLVELSDREAKEDIQAIEGEDVLTRLASVPISEWSYKDNPGTRHVGPMAQDFHAAFGLGRDERHISARDMAGVSLAAVKTLESRNRELEGEVDTLKDELKLMKAMLMQLAPEVARN